MQYNTFPHLESFGKIVHEFLDHSGHATGFEMILTKTDDLDLSLFPICSRPFYSAAAIEHLLWAAATIGHYAEVKSAKKEQEQPVTFLRRARVVVYEISAESPDRAIVRFLSGNITTKRQKMRIECFRDDKLVLTSDFIGVRIHAEKAKMMKKLRDSSLQQNLPVDDKDFDFYDPENNDIFFADFELGERARCLMTLERSLANHPLFSGSGDHVNTQMFTDQVEKLLPIWLEKKFGNRYSSKQWFPKEYDLDLRRVIEMEHVFEIEIESCTPWRSHGFHMNTKFYQFNDLCVQIDMFFLPDVFASIREAKL